MNETKKTYSKGFYGGKFLPFHKGHKYCIEYGANICEELVVILFYNSPEEHDIVNEKNSKVICNKKLLEIQQRINDIESFCATLKNVRFVALNDDEIEKVANEKGINLWDAETPFVLEAVGKFEAVFSSEPSYSDYFERAYPFAKHILIDVPRINVPISSTKIRNNNDDFAKKWR